MHAFAFILVELHVHSTSSSAFKFDLLSGFHNVKSTLNQTKAPTERKT